MGPENGNPKERWQTNISLLKWVAIVLPLAFLVAINYVGHFLVSSFIHSVPGFLALTAIMAMAVFMFSHFVFTLVKRAESKALSRHRELLTLNTVAAAASQPMKLEELLQIAVDGVVEAVGVDGGLACILDEENDELRHVAYRNIPEDLLGPLKKVKLEQGRVHTTVVRTGNPIYISDWNQDPRFSGTGRKPHFTSTLTVPLKSEGLVKGVLALVSRSHFTFDPTQVQFLLTVGGQLAVAIERTQLHQQVVSMAVLQERERIAREMHDGMAQLLGYINTQTIAVKVLLSKEQIIEAREELTKMEEAARDLYADVREGMLGLRAAAYSRDGLLPALREYAAQYTEMSDVKVVVEVADDTEHFHLAPSVEIQLMRIVQEALTNVRKHSGATAVNVEFANKGNELQVTVADNGHGFELERLQSTGWPRFGLQTMRERAEAVGGTLSIDTAPGRGTNVHVHIPVADESAEDMAS